MHAIPPAVPARLLALAPEVAEALADARPVVALESTIITHGMPWPANVETALAVEATVRASGAVPATIAVQGGKLRVGLTTPELASAGFGSLTKPMIREMVGRTFIVTAPEASTCGVTLITKPTGTVLAVVV